MIKIKFCGAARIVTGSNYYIDTGKHKILVDCGMFQGRKETTRLNYEPFCYKPAEIDFVFLTHAHIDHSGLLPKLVKEGFKGKIYATDATIDLCKIMLNDSAFIQEKDVEHENRRRARNGLAPRLPLYTQSDANNACKLFKKIKYNKKVDVNEEISIRYQDAGHIIGAASIELWVDGKKIVFSGDLGQWDVPIINNPTLIPEADYVFIESTYGDREHEPIGERDEVLLKIALETFKKGGKLMIPSFAVERTQELLFSIKKLIKSGRWPKGKVFLDSPLAIKATEVFSKHREFYDAEALRFKNPFTFPGLVNSLSVDQSKSINNVQGFATIIAGSGMANAGRIRHHFKHGLWNKKNTVCFVGYQAFGTLGRFILEGARKVRFMGQEVVVGADIRKINSYSAHGDFHDLIKWLEGFNKVKKVFIMHGEYDQQKAFKEKLKLKGFKSVIPKLHEEIEL